MRFDGYCLVRALVLLGLVLAPLTAQAQPASDGVTEEKVEAALIPARNPHHRGDAKNRRTGNCYRDRIQR